MNEIDTKLFFSDDVLKRMISVCEGMPKNVENLLRKEIDENIFALHFTLTQSRDCLYIYDDVSKEIEVIKNLKNLVKKYKILHSSIEGTQDNYLLPISDNLAKFHTTSINSIDYSFTRVPWDKIREQTKENILKYELYIECLNTNIRKGRPNKLACLGEYVFLFAKIYQAISNKKFTVDYYKSGDSGPLVITEGMSFVREAVEVIYSENCMRLMSKNRGERKYSPENIQTVCLYASRRLKKISNNEDFL